MRWLLPLLMACGQPEPTPDPPSTEPVTTSTGATTTPPPTTTQPTTLVTTPPVWGGCACPEAYDQDDFNSWDEGDHAVARPLQTPMRDQVVMFLHGTGQEPRNHDRILQTIHHAGFPVVAVKYPTSPGIEWCRDNLSNAEFSQCVEELRQAKLYGAEYTMATYIEDEDSITARFLNTLIAAELTDPDGPWDQFYDLPPADVTDHQNYIHWDRVLLMGFSQGGSLQGFLGRDFETAGLIMLSGPADEMVDWVTDDRATPTCKTVGFHHVQEDYGYYIQLNFDRFGLGTAPTPLTIEEGTCDQLSWPPLGGAHWLSTELQPDALCTSPDSSHGSMANDPCMNIVDAAGDDPFTLFRPYLGALCWLGDGGDC